MAPEPVVPNQTSTTEPANHTGPFGGSPSGTQIFLSYRREDTAAYARLIHESLARRFGQRRITMDLDPKDTHGDFVEALTVAVGSCGVLLVVIGEKWASVSYGPQLRKLDYPNDYVRLEIEIGLQRGIPIVPVLVEGATMPMEEELPFALSRLARHGAIELSDDTWNYDMERLIAHLERTRPA